MRETSHKAKLNYKLVCFVYRFAASWSFFFIICCCCCCAFSINQKINCVKGQTIFSSIRHETFFYWVQQKIHTKSVMSFFSFELAIWNWCVDIASDAVLRNIHLHRIAFSNQLEDFHFSEWSSSRSTVVVIVHIMIVIGNCLRTILLFVIIVVCAVKWDWPPFSYIYSRTQNRQPFITNNNNKLDLFFNDLLFLCDIASEHAHVRRDAVLYLLYIYI